MSHPVFRRIALAASILALANVAAVLAILVCSWMGLGGAFVAVAATSVMILTLALQIASVAVQAFHDGRVPIAIRGMGHDAWFTVLILTAIPGALWHSVAALAFPPMQLIMPNQVTPLFNVLLLVIVREHRHRRSTGVHA